MIKLSVFLKKCEEELLLTRQLSIDSLKSFDNLSLKDKKFCNPVIKLIRYPITDLMCNPIIESGNDSDNIIEQLLEFNEENYNSESRILICRLLPFVYGAG